MSFSFTITTVFIAGVIVGLIGRWLSATGPPPSPEGTTNVTNVTNVTGNKYYDTAQLLKQLTGPARGRATLSATWWPGHPPTFGITVYRITGNDAVTFTIDRDGLSQDEFIRLVHTTAELL